MKAAVVAVLLAVAACGYDNPPQTQVRIVIQSDLGVPDPIRSLRVVSISDPASVELVRADPPLPFLLSVFPTTPALPFSLSVQLSSAPVDVPRVDGGMPAVPDLLLVRNIVDGRFVTGELRMLVLPVLGKCACHGTTCPSPGDPECDGLVAPPLSPADDVTAAAAPDGFLSLAANVR